MPEPFATYGTPSPQQAQLRLTGARNYDHPAHPIGPPAPAPSHTTNHEPRTTNEARPPLTFTARHIAHVAGLTKRAVLDALAGVSPTSWTKTRGQPTPAWSLAVLPARLRQALDAAARRQGCADAIAFLARPTTPWSPPLSLSEIADAALAAAAKLREALRPSLLRADQLGLSAAEFERLGVEDYRRAFRHPISARYFRALYKRTRDRDAGRGCWNLLELYLPEHPARRAPASDAGDSEFGELQPYIASWEPNPSAAARANLLEAAFILLQERVPPLARSAGVQPARTIPDAVRPFRRRRLQFLWRSAPGLATSRNALRMRFDRDFAAWWQRGCNIAAVQAAKTPTKGTPAKPPYNPDDVAVIQYATARECGGRLSQAFRHCVDRGLVTDPRLVAARTNAGRKSYVPHALREQIGGLAKAETALHRGPRTADKMLPPLTRHFSGVRSMDTLEADDKTLDLYWLVPDGRGWFRGVRGQYIPAMDRASRRVLSHVLYSEGQYHSRLIRSMFRRVFEAHGVPTRLNLEGGLWKQSKLLSGGRAARLAQAGQGPFGPDEVQMGLRSLGVEFRFSRRARSKLVEGVLRQLDQRMAGEPGYVGRDEKTTRPDDVAHWLRQLDNGNAEALQHFYPMEQWETVLTGIEAAYNAEPQEGRLRHPDTRQPLSPDDAFELFWPWDDPPTPIDDACRMYLAAEHIPVEVRAPQVARGRFDCACVRFTLNGQTYVYTGEEMGRRIGHKLVAHFDPEMPDVCTFTDRNLRQPFTVKRLPAVHGENADTHYEQAVAQQHAALAPIKEMYAVHKAKFEPLFRRTIASRHVAELNAHLAEQQQHYVEAEKQSARQRKKARNLARELAVPGVLVEDNAAAPETLALLEEARRQHQQAGKSE